MTHSRPVPAANAVTKPTLEIFELMEKLAALEQPRRTVIVTYPACDTREASFDGQLERYSQ